MRLAPPLASGLVLGAALALPRAAHAQAPAQAGTWALTNVRIETVTKGTIEKGTIVIRGKQVQVDDTLIYLSKETGVDFGRARSS